VFETIRTKQGIVRELTGKDGFLSGDGTGNIPKWQTSGYAQRLTTSSVPPSEYISLLCIITSLRSLAWTNLKAQDRRVGESRA